MLRRLAVCGLAAALLASCSSAKDASSPDPTTGFIDTTTTSGLPTTPVIARVLSPERGSVQGSGGRGMVVALTFTARDATLLPAAFRLGGALPAPAAAARPGRNPAFPGLVVGLSTASTAIGGPTANLANLFQIISPSTQLDGSALVSAVWTNATVDFGSDVDTVLTAFTVSGNAPDVIPPSQANLDVNSNTVEVTFRVSPVTDGSTVATSPALDGATTTTARPTSTTTTRPASTTAPSTTTTRPATTTTAPPRTTTTTCLLPGLLC